MLKKFKKKSLKAKIAIIAFIIFMIALVSYVLYSTFKPEPPVAYEMSEVSYGSITDYLEVNGNVESGVTEKFIAIEGVMVEEVFVKVGDQVKKGDLIATFNVSAATSYVNSAKKDYDNALAEYNEEKANADKNSKRKVELEKEIVAIEKEIKAKENEIAKLESEIENSGTTTEMVPIPQEQIAAIVLQMEQNGATQEEIETFKESAANALVPSVSNDTEKQELLMQKNLELSQLNSKLSSLQAENAVLSSNNSETTLEALKTVVDAKKATYENTKKIYDQMKNGWYAENDGIVTVVNIKAGEIFVPTKENTTTFDLSAIIGEGVNNELINALMGDSVTVPTGSGVTVESYEDMIVNVTVGKADLLKIKVGMEAIVTSLDSEYKAEVIYVGATAVDSSGSFDINNIANSFIGGTGGANGALVKIKIHNPDEKVVIGFDVDIKIKLKTVEDVLRIPVESVVYNNGKYFVFVYDEAEGTAIKREVVKGTLDDTSYEIVSGLVEGEKVIKSPDPNMEDGTKVQPKNA